MYALEDTFLLFKSNSHIDTFLNFVNSQHPNIKFTCDKEKDSSLLLLDVNIQKGETEFTTLIYTETNFHWTFLQILYFFIETKKKS